MAYDMRWHIPGKVLYLTLEGEPPIFTFIEIDRQIADYLKQTEARITLIVNADDCSVSAYRIEQIRVTQTYLHSYQIEHLLVISSSKVNRLAMLLLFNLCRPRLQFCDNFEQAQTLLDIYGITTWAN